MRWLPIFFLATLAGTAAAEPAMKPGLWEMRISKNVVDGQDTSAQSAQMDGLNEKMKEQMARMSPEQRAQMGAMMSQRGMGMAMGGGGGIQMCITPEMSKRDVPVADKDGACQPVNVHRSGNRMTYELNCVSRGVKTTGTGESTLRGDSVANRSDTTVVDNGETHRIQTESEMRFVKADCGDVKPLGTAKQP